MQYHSEDGRGEYLPRGYNFVTQITRKRRLFILCVREVLLYWQQSGPNQVVVNGMSPSNRGSVGKFGYGG